MGFSLNAGTRCNSKCNGKRSGADSFFYLKYTDLHGQPFNEKRWETYEIQNFLLTLKGRNFLGFKMMKSKHWKSSIWQKQLRMSFQV